MAKNYFHLGTDRDLDLVYNEALLWFKGRQYEVEGILKNQIYVIQARKTGTIRTLLGTNIAFKLKIYISDTNADELILETSRGKWVQNIAGASFTAIFTGGLSFWTGVTGAGWTLILENELINHLQKACRLNRIQSVSETNSVEFNKVPKNNYPVSESINPNQKQVLLELKEEINKLQSAFSSGILTEEEFKRKKAILQLKLDDYEIDCLMEGKIKNLEKAFADGILTQEEFLEKLENLESKTKEEINKEKYLSKHGLTITKLKEALQHGIITQAEYDRKISTLS
ncbi:MAG: SHOCT domain-containing protein [Cyanobacterium sp. T60_A2020_053]|nr:SHOCT domain-containing protein [Cyanobacterium sp. T60_A2020_053]